MFATRFKQGGICGKTVVYTVMVWYGMPRSFKVNNL